MRMESQQEKLKQHFAGRVTTQARVVLEAWQQLTQANWNDDHWLSELQHATDKLGRYAARFEMLDHLSIAQSLNAALKKRILDGGRMDGASIHELEAGFLKLAGLTGRKSDRSHESGKRTYLRPPVYICLNDAESSRRAVKQLQFFGFRGESFQDTASLLRAVYSRRPEALLIDTDFTGPRNEGITLTKTLQARLETPLPVLFVCDRESDIDTRLESSRAGGEEFIQGSSNTSVIIEKIDQYTRGNTLEPYRILVIDDSKAQATFMENTLKKAGMEVKAITDPMIALEAFQQFEPEIIIMDMYMPGCTGTELAKVLRQDDKFMGVPIIYLSAEDDINKQLHAMSLGGDDFLVKPINPRHLVATIHNRGRRARSLNALLVRDSLTGLYNHTHILNLMNSTILACNRKELPLCVAMMDIDHFKNVNDTYGHPMGDRVLKSLSLFLKQRLRRSDHIGRYGGEEFMLVLPGTRIKDGQRIMEEILNRFRELGHPHEQGELKVTFSCGVAELNGPEEDSKVLSQRADEALYRAKHGGRNRVCT
ncbi:MAG: diguanylate cyclase [Hahellaceae bacterium]|nr:diguanylate cyclase [Hahellaceae bacterium]